MPKPSPKRAGKKAARGRKASAEPGIAPTPQTPEAAVPKTAHLSLTLGNEHELLQAIMEYAGVQLAYLDLQFNFVYVNAAYAKGSGHTVQELIGRNHFALFPNAENQAIFERVRDTGEPVSYSAKPFEYADQPERGVTYWDWTLAPVKDMAGRVQGLLFSLLDVTDRKRAEQELLEAKEQLESRVRERTAELEAIYRTAPVGLGVVDRELRFLRINDRLAELNGLPAEQHIGRTVGEVAPAFEAQARAAQRRILETGEPLLNLEFRGQTPAQPGVERIWNASWLSLRDDAGDIIGINVVVEDVTERKKVEEDIRRANAYNRNLIEVSLDPLVTIGPDGKITDVNAATAAATGFGRDELIGKDFADYFTEPDKARAGYQRVFKENELHDYPLEILHRDGHVTPVLYNASVYRDEAGAVVGVFAAARDITELRRAEQTVKAERQRLYDVLETLPAYAVLLTPDYHVPFANRFFRERFGESQGRRCFEYLFGRSEPCEVCETYRVLKTNAPQRWEWTGPDGRIYDIHDFPFTDSDGSQLIFEMGIDITEQKQAEAKALRYQEHLEEVVQERTARLESANTKLTAEIAERERAEEELRQQREWLRVTLNSIGDGVIAAGTDGRITFLNPVAADLTGWSPAEALGQPIEAVFRIVNEKTHAPTESIVSRVLKENRVIMLGNHTALLAKDGREIPVEDSGAPILDAAGNVTGAVLVFHDVAERKRNAEAIQRQNTILAGINRIFEEAIRTASEEELGQVCLGVAETLTESKFGFISELGQDGKLHELAMSDTGWAACSMYDQAGRRRMAGNFDLRGLYGRVVTDGKSLIANDPASHPDHVGVPKGHPGLTAFLGVPLLQEGKVLGMIAVANREGGYRVEDRQALEVLAPAVVTALARTRAEAALQRTSAALAERVTELETLMEVAPVGIAIGHDPEGQRITANRTLTEWLGESPGTNLSLSTPESQRQATYRVFREGKPVPIDELPVQYATRHAAKLRDAELRIVRADGSGIDLLANADPLLDEQKRVRGAVATFMDITARKQAERERAELLAREQAARSQAEAAVRTRDHFITLASHELKTPLTSLRGYTELVVQRATGLSGQEARMIRTIYQQTLRLEKMISALLDISRIERGQLSLERAPLELGSLLQHVVQDIQPTIRVHTIELTRSPEQAIVEGDEGRLEQVLQNLIQNAVKYSPSGGRVSISLLREENMARIAVSDQGIGIPKAALPELFTRFFRAENAEAKHISGLGIGLYVAREIVRLHGGDITVESEEGKGSTFTVCLPLAAR